MKNLYKIFIFFLMFQMSAMIVGTMNIFPSATGLYSDLSVDAIQGKDAVGIISYLITPDGGYEIAGKTYPGFTIGLVTTFFAILGVVVGAATKNVSLAALSLIVIIFVPMIAKSTSFFNRLFTTWDVTALTYLGLTIGVGIMAILIITLLETPTHGKSGE